MEGGRELSGVAMRCCANLQAVCVCVCVPVDPCGLGANMLGTSTMAAKSMCTKAYNGSKRCERKGIYKQVTSIQGIYFEKEIN